jgi:hypothetical protein
MPDQTKRTEPETGVPDLGILQIALSYLTTRYAIRACPGIAHGVVHHLEHLLAHPEVVASRVMSGAYQRLLDQWLQIASVRIRAPLQAQGSRGETSVH